MTEAPKPAPQHADLADKVLAGGAITADDVATLRQGVYADGAVDRDEVDLLFYLNDKDIDKDTVWNEFFVSSLTDYFVWKQDPRGVLSDADGALLIARITHDGKIEHNSEFTLLVDIVSKARQCPEEVVLLALEAIEESVIDGSGKLFGAGRRRPGLIDEGEVEVIRMGVFGSGGGGGLTVTRREAELLFRLNNKTSGKKNAASWRDLFVTVVGSYLMHPQGPPEPIDVEEIRRRDESLARMAEGEGIGALFADMFGASGGGIREDLKRKQKEELSRALKTVEEEFEREKIDRAEIEWLIERLQDDDRVDGNERALLAYIKQKAVEIDPALNPYFEKYGV